MKAHNKNLQWHTNVHIYGLSLAIGDAHFLIDKIKAGDSYFNYFYKKDSRLVSNQNEIINNNNLKLNDGSTIKEILYESYDNKGNKFVIKSESGSFDEKKKNEIYMVDVEAKIILVILFILR